MKIMIMRKILKIHNKLCIKQTHYRQIIKDHWAINANLKKNVYKKINNFTNKLKLSFLD